MIEVRLYDISRLPNADFLALGAQLPNVKFVALTVSTVLASRSWRPGIP